MVYTIGIIDWKQTELEQLDRMTYKTMNFHGGRHP